jgi:predicted TIM-barrel fold metal-dependent hydrolase
MFGSSNAQLNPPTRRNALQLLLAAGSLTGLAGCCSMRHFATPVIGGDLPSMGTPLKPTVRKSAGAPKLCIDAHTHFFNGTDVPVKGYLAGPVAHDLPKPLKELAELIAPLADELVSLAPTAADEFKDLVERFAGSNVDKKQPNISALSKEAVLNERTRRSEEFYRIVRGSKFELRYNEIKAELPPEVRSLLSANEKNRLGPTSLLDAANAGTAPSRTRGLSPAQKRIVDSTPYADGFLAFINHMLSPRWHNIRDYAEVYSINGDAFGIDYALGALVDFDGWLDCAPRSAHDDQVKLHQLLSALTGGYMRPLVAYNPWTDIREEGAALKRVIDAVTNRGFIGVKIYPPNGFYPYGNMTRKGSPRLGPSFNQLDAALEQLWEFCTKHNVPVMAHTNRSSGKDDHFDELGGPPGWKSLVARFKDSGSPPVNLAHFGGASGGTTWTGEFADLMAQRGGERIYGDIGYWDALQCRDTQDPKCGTAQLRLADALKRPSVNKRVMYGTDWFMLSTRRDWGDYPYELMASTKGLPIAPDDLFGLNAQRCYSRANLV